MSALSWLPGTLFHRFRRGLRRLLSGRHTLLRAARVAGPGARLAFAAALACAGTALIWRLLPVELNARTDVVGYPIHANFNINRYFWAYWLLAGFLPVATFGLFVALGRLTGSAAPSGGRDHRPPLPEPSPAPMGRPRFPESLSRAAFVGSIWGVQVAIIIRRTDEWMVGILLPVALVYVGVVALAAHTIGWFQARGGRFGARVALVNASVAPLLLLGLHQVSAATRISVASNGAVYHYPWLPAWLALVATAIAVIWVGRGVRRAATDAALHRVEARVLLLIAAPIAIFLSLAAMQGDPGPMDLFQEGETLAPARLLGNGVFPWRDLLVIHGPLADFFKAEVGLRVLEDSRWAFVTGQSLLLNPVCWLLMYYLCAYLFRRNWLFLVGTQLTVVLGLIRALEVRWGLQPLVLLLLAALLDKATHFRAAAFTALLVIQAVVTAEAGLAVAACGATVVLYELYYRDRESGCAVFRRTLYCALWGVVAVAVWFVFLLSKDALGDFLFIYSAFSHDHHLSAGIPLQPASKFDFWFAAAAPPALVVLTFGFFAARTRLNRPLRNEDWVMAAGALLLVPYYHKFLGRADGHVEQPYAVAVPLVFYAVYRLVTWAETELSTSGLALGRWRAGRHTITAPVLIAVAAAAPVPLERALTRIPVRFQPTVAHKPSVTRIGFQARDTPMLRTIQPAPPDVAGPELIRDLRRVLKAWLGPDESIFDFTNSPGLFYYVLERSSPTRYYNVGIATWKRTQGDLIDELVRKQPKLAAFHSEWVGMPAWDGVPNQVRHYDVSQYLLKHYRPVLYSHGYLLMARDDALVALPGSFAAMLQEAPATDDLYFRTFACDWGYAPNFLTTGPASGAPALRVAFRPELRLLASGWAIERGASRPAAEVIAAVDGRVIARVRPAVQRPDVARELGNPGVTGSGFEIDAALELPGRDLTGSDLRFYGISPAGMATELYYTDPGLAARPPAGYRRLELTDGHSVKIVPDAVPGFVSSVEIEQSLVLAVPPAFEPREYAWLEIQTRSPLAENAFTLADSRGDRRRGIHFRTLARGARVVRVQVGACSQWYGFDPARLALSLDVRQDVDSIALLP